MSSLTKNILPWIKVIILCGWGMRAFLTFPSESLALDEVLAQEYKKAIDLAREGQLKEALKSIQDIYQQSPDDVSVTADYIVILCWNEDWSGALALFEKNSAVAFPDFVWPEIAKAYRMTKQVPRAVEVYRKYLFKHPEDTKASAGLMEAYLDNNQVEEAKKIFQNNDQALSAEIADALARLAKILLDQKSTAESQALIDKVLAKFPDHRSTLFVQAEIYDGQKDFLKAIEIYDRILQDSPTNQAALNLKSRALMDLGANSVALENIEEEKGSGDPKLKEQARGNIAMNQIRWEEAREALMTIKLEEAAASSDPTLIKTDPQSLRRQWDYMLALRQAEHMTKFLEEYHKYEQAGVAIPSWIRQAAGDALLYLRQPQKALGLYESLLTEVPTDFKIKMAMYYTLVELGRFNEAEKILQELDKDQPVRILERGLLRDNWRKADIALNRVWLLMYQDRLEVAQRDLVKDLELAPFNTALRSTMAHIYLWRGWPRRSLEEFKIVRNIDPAFLQAHIGYIIALNDNAQKKEAREEIKTLARQFPADRHVQRVQRMFDVQDMTALTLSGNYSKEFPGEDEFIFSTQLEQPLNFHHTFSMNLLRRETSRVGEKDDITRRIYLGDIWEINRSLDWRASLAADYENGENFGWTSQLTLTPDDYWKVNVSYDSHSLAVPLRSRAQGVDAREYTASMTYRLSETFNTSWTAAWKDFSDHNNNWSYSWDTETALVTRAYWKMRLRTEFDAAFNSRNDVPYFSPHAVYSFSLVPTIEHVWFRRYERAWVDRLFLGIGQQWQDEFAVKNIGYIRYEQDHHFSEVCQWLWGTTYALRNYDGNDVNTLNVDSTLRVKF